MRELATLPQSRLTHGIGYPLGGTICDQERHIGEFRRWTEELGSPWTSEHLNILEVLGASGPEVTGFLMPPLQNEAEVAVAATNIRRRAAAIGRPLAFETGTNYFTPRPSEMGDGDFFAAIAEAADCGILLDLNNLWINEKNGRAKIGDVLAKIPVERVWELHLAGAEFAHGHWLDAHSGGVDPELAMIAADFVGDLPNLGAIIFEIAPDRVAKFGATAFLREMETLQSLWEKTRRVPTVPTSDSARFAVPESIGLTPEEWERLIAVKLLPACYRPSASNAQLTASEEQSFELYVKLAKSFRHGAIAELLKNTIRLLLTAIGEAALHEFLDDYTATVAPTTFPSDEALNFGRFVDSSGLSVPGLRDILAFERASIEAAADGRAVQVRLTRAIDLLLGDVIAGRVPEPCPGCSPVVLELSVDPEPSVRLIE